MNTAERWLPVVGYEGLYEVSNHGRVRSLDRTVTHVDGRVRKLKGKVLSSFLDGVRTRYWSISLGRNGTLVPTRIHVLVAEAFICPRPPGMVVRHGELGKDVNTPENLRWGTQGDNIEDTYRQRGHHNTNKTHCSRGQHEYTPENTYIQPSSGGRICRTCKAEDGARRYARRKAAANS